MKDICVLTSTLEFLKKELKKVTKQLQTNPNEISEWEVDEMERSKEYMINEINRTESKLNRIKYVLN